jgi:hypothetical protein
MNAVKAGDFTAVIGNSFGMLKRKTTALPTDFNAASLV